MDELVKRFPDIFESLIEVTLTYAANNAHDKEASKHIDNLRCLIKKGIQLFEE